MSAQADDDATLAQLEAIFRKVMNRPGLVLQPATTAADVAGWDSLKHIELMVAVEAAFGIRFRTSEVASFRNVADLLAAIARRRAPSPR